jgi:hypothetical protein
MAISGSRNTGRLAHLPCVRDRISARCEWLGRVFALVVASMPTLRELFQLRRDTERRAVGRTTIKRDVVIFFAGQESVRACCVRDVTNHGAGVLLNGLNIVPSELGISFDNFRTTRRCRLIWRDGDFVGVAFES